MTETTVLSLCFAFTFGFIIYKTSHLIKDLLNDYRNKITDQLNESERIKLQAINLFNEAEKRINYMNDEIERQKHETDIKIETIKNDFNKKLQIEINNILDNYNKQIELEKNEALKSYEINIVKTVEKILTLYADQISSVDKTSSIDAIIKATNFKMLVNKK